MRRGAPKCCAPQRSSSANAAFSETRISDVAKRAGVSSAVVICHFGTRDRLLVDALRYAEDSFYEAAGRMLSEVPAVRDRLSLC